MTADNTPTPAKLPRILAAIFYDGLVLIALLMVAAVLAVAINGGNAIPPGALWFELYLYLVGLLYFGYCWLYKQQTLGMRAWRLAITPTHTTTMSWQQAVTRYLGATLSLAFVGLGYFWLLIDKERLTLHDRLSGTRLMLLNNTKDLRRSV